MGVTALADVVWILWGLIAQSRLRSSPDIGPVIEEQADREVNDERIVFAIYFQNY
jgi:hypothetical protein